MCLASLMAIGAAAQGQQPTTETQKPAAAPEQKPAAAQASKVTISGCLQAPLPAPAGAPAAPPAAKFELANAKIVSGGPVGTSGATTASRYRVEGEDKTISPHLDHQVELTGTVSPAAPSTGATAPLLKVESLKMVSAKCS
jgi:hypothetical protein